MTEGAFEISNEEDLENYDIKPKDNVEVPKTQREFQQRVYATRGVLKLLREQGVFENEQTVLKEFQTRILETARAGLTEYVQLELAVGALEQVREELVIRKGKRVVYRYLTRLAWWCLSGVGVGVLFVLASAYKLAPWLVGYGPVLIGAMAGAWLSVASGRRDVAFEDLPNFLGSKVEPAVRMAFVGLLAMIVALFIELGAVTITVGNLAFVDFSTSTTAALLLGVITGIGERALSVRIIQRAREIVAQ